MWLKWECSMKASLMHSLHSHFRVCCTSAFSSPNLFLRGFWTILTLSTVKSTFFIFRNTLSHFEKSRFRMYLLFMLTNFEYHPTKFQIIYKTTLFEKSIIHHCNLDIVKKTFKISVQSVIRKHRGRPPILRTCQISRLVRK